MVGFDMKVPKKMVSKNNIMYLELKNNPFWSNVWAENAIFWVFWTKTWLFYSKIWAFFAKRGQKMQFFESFLTCECKNDFPKIYTWIKMQKSDFKTHKSGLKTQFFDILSIKRDSPIKLFWCLKTKIMISMQCDQHIRAKLFISKQKRFQNLEIYRVFCKNVP